MENWVVRLGNLRKNVQWPESCRIIMNFKTSSRWKDFTNKQRWSFFHNSFLHVFQTKKREEKRIFPSSLFFLRLCIVGFWEARQSVSHIMFCHLEVIIVKNFCLSSKTSVIFCLAEKFVKEKVCGWVRQLGFWKFEGKIVMEDFEEEKTWSF